MSSFRIHSPIAISPSIREKAWQSMPSDQQSRSSERSIGTIQHTPQYRPSSGSARSLGSNSSVGLHVGNENLVARRNASHSSLMLSPYTANSLVTRRTSKQASLKSSWRNDTSPASQENRFSSLLAEAGPLEDIDLNAACGESFYSRHGTGQDAESNAGRDLSFDIRQQETLSTPRSPSCACQETTGSRNTEHTVRIGNPVKRLVGNLRAQGPKRRHSLNVRKERWVLDDFDEAKPEKTDLPQRSRINGHQKASSWSSSGIRSAIKSATVRLQSATNRPHSPILSRARILKSNRGSRTSNAASRLSMDGNQAATRAIEHAARNRAVQRRRILEELVSSEESYVADLKVLLHVGVF